MRRIATSCILESCVGLSNAWISELLASGVNSGLGGPIGIVKVRIGQALPKAGSQNRRQRLSTHQHMPEGCTAIQLCFLYSHFALKMSQKDIATAELTGKSTDRLLAEQNC